MQSQIKHKPMLSMIESLIVVVSFVGIFTFGFDSVVDSFSVKSSSEYVPIVAIQDGGVSAAFDIPDIANSISPVFSTSNLKSEIAIQISSYWNVPLARSKEVVDVVSKVSKIYNNVDPMLVLAIVAQESGFRNVGNPGESMSAPIDPRKPHGLMQVSGKWHAEKFPGGLVAVTSNAINLKIGVQVLHEYIVRESGNINKALLRYNGSLDDKTEKYSKEVLRKRDFFQQIESNSHRLSMQL